MNDQETTVQVLKKLIADFVQERHWQEFHTAKNLSMAMAVEVAELMELLQWLEKKEDIEREIAHNKQAIEDELADIIAYVLSFCTVYNIDISRAVIRKMEKNRQKYPLDKVKGSDKKSTYEKYQAIKRAKQEFN